jgi:mannitol/fructose-specific phosphotransferase system IIA component
MNPLEKRNVEFNFIESLLPKETVVSSVITVAVKSGIDATKDNVLSGSASIVSGYKVVQLVQGGLNGVTYEITCVATLSTGKKLTGILNLLMESGV